MGKEFKIGEKVNAYGPGYKASGIIKKIRHADETGPEAQLDSCEDWFHVKQLRRLIRKPRKEITREIFKEAWNAGILNIKSEMCGEFASVVSELESRLGRKLKDA